MKNRKPWVLISIFVFALLLRLPSLLEPYSYADEGIYLVLGQGLRKGLVWYSQIHDNKPPLLYLLAAIAGTQFWFRLILLFGNFFNIYLIYCLAKHFFEEKVSLLVTFVFAIFSTIPLFEGNIANAEVFMILPVTAGVFLIAQSAKRKAQSDSVKLKAFFIAGVLFALATLFKVPAGFDFAGICFFLIFLSRKKLLPIAYCLLPMILGFVLLILSTMVYYWSKGALKPYLAAAFLQNIGYLSSWGGRSQANITQSGLMQRGSILLFILFIIFLFRKRLSKNFLLVITWFFFALFGALLSERPYPHYLMQVVPAAALILGFLFSKNNLQRLGCLGCLGCLVFSFAYFKFWHYQTVPYYQTFYQYLLGNKSQQDWQNYFGGHIERTYQVAAMIKENTAPEERIFVWGTEPGIYYLSERLPVGRYTVSYHIKDFDGWQETMLALEDYQPKFIVKLKDEAEFPQLNELLQKDYFLQETIQDLEVYEKISAK